MRHPDGHEMTSIFEYDLPPADELRTRVRMIERLRHPMWLAFVSASTLVAAWTVLERCGLLQP